MAITLVGSSGVSAADINGASVTLIWDTVPSDGDVAIVANLTTASTALAQTVMTGSGVSYVRLASNSVLGIRGSVWYHVCSNGETTATCSGSGVAADVTSAAGFIFRGSYSPITISENVTGAIAGQPDSLPISVFHIGDAVVSIGMSSSDSGIAVTPPIGYLNLVSTGATDARACQVGISWITSTNVIGPLSYDPGSYAGFTSAPWMAYTITLRSTDPFTPFGMVSTERNIDFSSVDVVSY